MNISGVGAAGLFAVYGMKRPEVGAVEKNFADEISKAVERLGTERTDDGTAAAKMRYMEDNVGEVSELEDKYCSLCGSMIKEDGSCPLCGVPTFISGNGRSGNQKISQASSGHAASPSSQIRIK